MDDTQHPMVEPLLSERQGYEARISAAQATGDDEAVDRYKGRIKQVDAELAKVGYEAPAPAKAAAKRTAAATDPKETA